MENQQKRNQSEWYALALQASDALFAKQQELFDGMADVVFYYAEVTRFDTFVRMSIGVNPKTYTQDGLAIKVAENIGNLSEGIQLSEYSSDDELDAFVDNSFKMLEKYAASIEKIIKSYKK